MLWFEAELAGDFDTHLTTLATPGISDTSLATLRPARARSTWCILGSLAQGWSWQLTRTGLFLVLQ